MGTVVGINLMDLKIRFGNVSNLEWDFPLNDYSDRVNPQDDAKWL